MTFNAPFIQRIKTYFLHSSGQRNREHTHTGCQRSCRRSGIGGRSRRRLSTPRIAHLQGDGVEVTHPQCLRVMSRAVTFKSVFAETLVLVFGAQHAVTSVEAGPAVTGAVVHAVADGSAFCEAVGQVHFLVVDGDLRRS